MPAEPAAAPDVSEVTESTASLGGAEHQQIEREHDQESTTVGGRAHELLRELGVSDEVQDLVKPTERQNAKEENAEDKIPGESESPERTRDAEPAKSAEEKGPKAEGVKDEDEQPVTAEEQKAWPKEALDRIHKTTAQKHAERKLRVAAERAAAEATEQARQLHEQLQNTSRVRPAPTQHDPLADVLTVQDLQAVTQQYEDLLAFAEMNSDGATEVVVGKDEAGNEVTRDFSAQEMAHIRASSGRILRQAVPARAGYLREQQEHERYARATLPEMFDPKTDEYKATQQILRTLPELTRLPGYQQWIAWAIIGREKVVSEVEAWKAGKGGAANGKNGKIVDPKVAPFLMKHPPLAPSVPSTRGASTTAAPTKDSERTAAVEEFTKEGGGDDALEKLVARTRSQQAAPRKNAVLV